MNVTVNKLSLAGDTFMPEIHLRQQGFTYSACGPFSKNTERIKKVKEIGDWIYIYQNELDKACFQHDVAYGYFKILIEEQLLIKYYMIQHLVLLKIQNVMDINVDLLRWLTYFSIKKLQVALFKKKLCKMKNYLRTMQTNY